MDMRTTSWTEEHRVMKHSGRERFWCSQREVRFISQIIVHIPLCCLCFIRFYLNLASNNCSIYPGHLWSWRYQSRQLPGSSLLHVTQCCLALWQPSGGLPCWHYHIRVSREGCSYLSGTPPLPRTFLCVLRRPGLVSSKT